MREHREVVTPEVGSCVAVGLFLLCCRKITSPPAFHFRAELVCGVWCAGIYVQVMLLLLLVPVGNIRIKKKKKARSIRPPRHFLFLPSEE